MVLAIMKWNALGVFILEICYSEDGDLVYEWMYMDVWTVECFIAIGLLTAQKLYALQLLRISILCHLS